MQFFAEAAEEDFDVLDHRVALGLVLERLFLRPVDGVLEQVVETADAGRFSLLDQLRGPAGDEHRLHVALRLGEVEELPPVGVVPHLDEPLRLVVADVREGAGGDVHVRIAAACGGGDDFVGQLDQPLQRLASFAESFDGLLQFLGQMSGLSSETMPNSACSGGVAVPPYTGNLVNRCQVCSRA